MSSGERASGRAAKGKPNCEQRTQTSGRRRDLGGRDEFRTNSINIRPPPPSTSCGLLIGVGRSVCSRGSRGNRGARAPIESQAANGSRKRSYGGHLLRKRPGQPKRALCRPFALHYLLFISINLAPRGGSGARRGGATRLASSWARRRSDGPPDRQVAAAAANKWPRLSRVRSTRRPPKGASKQRQGNLHLRHEEKWPAGRPAGGRAGKSEST